MSQFSENVIAKYESGNGDQIAGQLKKMIADEQDWEGEIAWTFGYCFEKGLDDVFQLAPNFAKKYPDSIYPVMVMYSDILARRGRFDEASSESRIYLRKVSEAGLLENLEDKPLIADGVSRAFLLLTSAYVEAGARSYAKKILNLATKYDLPKNWLAFYKKSIDQINAELKDEATSSLNDLWERFFAGGGGANEIYPILEKMGFLLLRRRIDLIESNFRYDRHWKCDDAELFKLVMADQFGRLVLA